MATEGFEWDEAKASTNLTKHGIAFSIAVEIFFDPRLVLLDTSRAIDRELRFKAIGMVDGEMLTAVFTRRGERFRLISARKSNPPERKRYDRPLHA